MNILRGKIEQTSVSTKKNLLAICCPYTFTKMHIKRDMLTRILNLFGRSYKFH